MAQVPAESPPARRLRLADIRPEDTAPVVARIVKRVQVVNLPVAAFNSSI